MKLFYFSKLSTCIVTRGTLRRGAILVGGQAWAKVRGLVDHTGQTLEAAPPGTPVEILGWRELPHAGDQILEVESEKKAHSVLRFRHAQSQMDRATSDLDAIRQKEEQPTKSIALSEMHDERLDDFVFDWRLDLRSRGRRIRHPRLVSF